MIPWRVLFGTFAFAVLTAGVASALPEQDSPARTLPVEEDRPPAKELPLAADGGPLVTYSGLRVYKDGSSTFQVKLTHETPVTFSQQGTALTFVLKGARVDVKNNKNPLRAEYFQSNVMRTQLFDGETGVELKIGLRKAATPVHKMFRYSGGAILRVDIPPPA